MDEAVLEKIIGLFRPATSDFLDFKAADVVLGPDDRAMIGCTTHFPLGWLVDDFGFSEAEARWFVDRVHAQKYPPA